MLDKWLKLLMNYQTFHVISALIWCFNRWLLISLEYYAFHFLAWAKKKAFANVEERSAHYHVESRSSFQTAARTWPSKQLWHSPVLPRGRSARREPAPAWNRGSLARRQGRSSRYALYNLCLSHGEELALSKTVILRRYRPGVCRFSLQQTSTAADSAH